MSKIHEAIDILRSGIERADYPESEIMKEALAALEQAEPGELAVQLAEGIESDLLARDDCASFWLAISEAGRKMIKHDWADYIQALLEQAEPEPTMKAKAAEEIGRLHIALDIANNRIAELEDPNRVPADDYKRLQEKFDRLTREKQAQAERIEELQTSLNEQQKTYERRINRICLNTGLKRDPLWEGPAMDSD